MSKPAFSAPKSCVMMLGMRNKILVLGLALCFLGPPVLAVERDKAATTDADRRVFRALAVNRNMMDRFEAEYALLRQVEATTPPIVKTEMRKLRYKMKALSEDTQRLKSELSDEEQAKIFLREITEKARKQAAEAEINDPIRRLHEEGLRLVAEKRMAEAAKVYEKITIRAPYDDQAFIILGHVYLLSGDYEKSERAFHGAVSVNGENIHQIVPFYENLILETPEDDQVHSHLG